MSENFERREETQEKKIERLRNIVAEKRDKAMRGGIEEIETFQVKIVDFAGRFREAVRAENPDGDERDYALYAMLIGGTGGNPSKVDFEGMTAQFIEHEL